MYFSYHNFHKANKKYQMYLLHGNNMSIYQYHCPLEQNISIPAYFKTIWFEHGSSSFMLFSIEMLLGL